MDLRSPPWAAWGWGTSIHQAALGFHTSFSLSVFPFVFVYLVSYKKLLSPLCTDSAPLYSQTLLFCPQIVHPPSRSPPTKGEFHPLHTQLTRASILCCQKSVDDPSPDPNTRFVLCAHCWCHLWQMVSSAKQGFWMRVVRCKFTRDDLCGNLLWGDGKRGEDTGLGIMWAEVPCRHKEGHRCGQLWGWVTLLSCLDWPSTQELHIAFWRGQWPWRWYSVQLNLLRRSLAGGS